MRQKMYLNKQGQSGSLCIQDNNQFQVRTELLGLTKFSLRLSLPVMEATDHKIYRSVILPQNTLGVWTAPGPTYATGPDMGGTGVPRLRIDFVDMERAGVARASTCSRLWSSTFLLALEDFFLTTGVLLLWKRSRKIRHRQLEHAHASDTTH